SAEERRRATITRSRVGPPKSSHRVSESATLCPAPVEPAHAALPMAPIELARAPRPSNNSPQLSPPLRIPRTARVVHSSASTLRPTPPRRPRRPPNPRPPAASSAPGLKSPPAPPPVRNLRSRPRTQPPRPSLLPWHQLAKHARLALIKPARV